MGGIVCRRSRAVECRQKTRNLLLIHHDSGVPFAVSRYIILSYDVHPEFAQHPLMVGRPYNVTRDYGRHCAAAVSRGWMQAENKKPIAHSPRFGRPVCCVSLYNPLIWYTPWICSAPINGETPLQCNARRWEALCAGGLARLNVGRKQETYCSFTTIRASRLLCLVI